MKKTNELNLNVLFLFIKKNILILFTPAIIISILTLYYINYNSKDYYELRLTVNEKIYTANNKFTKPSLYIDSLTFPIIDKNLYIMRKINFFETIYFSFKASIADLKKKNSDIFEIYSDSLTDLKKIQPTDTYYFQYTAFTNNPKKLADEYVKRINQINKETKEELFKILSADILRIKSSFAIDKKEKQSFDEINKTNQIKKNIRIVQFNECKN